MAELRGALDWGTIQCIYFQVIVSRSSGNDWFEA
jgi:hypothetical protein